LQHILNKPRPPVFAKSRCLDPAKLAVAKAEFSTMEKAGVIPHSNSPWTFKYGQEELWRLEAATVPDCYPLPNIADFTSGISGSTIF